MSIEFASDYTLVPHSIQDYADFVDCLDADGVKRHIRNAEDDSGLALCLRSPYDDIGKITYNEVVDALTENSDSSNDLTYCRECVREFGEIEGLSN